MGAYTRVLWRGRTFNKRTVAMIEEVEKRLGYELTIFQGSYNAGGVSQSAGTHDGGGAVDCWGQSLADAEMVVMVMRRVGFAAWIRYPNQGDWNYHIHAIAIGDRDLSVGAKSQVQAYLAGLNGLASGGADYHPRPNPQPVFQYWALNQVSLSRVTREFKAKWSDKKATIGVKRVQRALNRKADADLTVDGLAGRQTKRAYRRWERQIGMLIPQGTPRLKSLKRLGRGSFSVKD